MPSNRRQFLASSLGVATALATAGCIDDGPGAGTGSGTDSPTDSPGESKGSPSETETPPPESAQRTVGGETVSVTDIVAEKAVAYESLMGSGGVVAPEGQQFVVASVHSDAELELGSFSLHAGGETWVATDVGDQGGQNYSVAGHGRRIVGGPGAGGDDPRYVTFELDSPIEAEDARIVLERSGERGEWDLPDEASETLAESAPSFELDSLDAPERVDRGESLDVELTATNTTEAEGRFLAAVYWPTQIADDDESHLIEQSVEGGETVTASLSIDTEYAAAEDGSTTLRVKGHVSAEQEITVVGGTTTA